MKQFLLFPLALTLCLCLILSLLPSCLPSSTDEATSAAPSDWQEDRIRQLEEEIDFLQQHHQSNDVLQQEKLQQLQDQLSALTNQTESAAPNVSRFLYRTENGCAIITGFSGNVTSLVIPSAIDGYPVIAVGEGAFRSSSLERVIISGGITKLDWFSFYQCASLTQITVPPSVSAIGHAAFDGCAPSLSVSCTEDSFAHRYCQSYGIQYTLI